MTAEVHSVRHARLVRKPVRSGRDSGAASGQNNQMIGPIRAVLIGAAGRMGRSILQTAATQDAIEIAAAVVRRDSDSVGRDAGELLGHAPSGLRFSGELAAALATAAVAIDFSSAAALADNLDTYAAARVPLLVGTTGLSLGDAARLQSLASSRAVLLAPNTSVGVAVLCELVRHAARALPAEFDLAVAETHHVHKKDAPSGTALALAAAAAPRATGPIASIRTGDVVGEHTVSFTGQGEKIVLLHEATDRTIFARGALRAAVWLAAQPPGFYTMSDVIGEKTVA